jgi:glycosyltransferase involved in cell wall biosynthesis
MMTALTLNDLPLPPSGKVGWPWTRQSQPLPETMSDGSLWPRISIVTPSYNQGKFLEATIRSVLLQGYPNLEYIVIDGGSTDGSLEILKKYEKYLCYWHSKQDRGQADAINQGLANTSGEILGWINSDDLYVRGTFETIVKAFQTHPDYIVVHGNRILINESGAVTGWFCLPPFDPKTHIYNVCSETAFWRRSAMQQTGLLNASLQFAMDLEFFGRLYKQGKFLKLNDYLGYFRCHSEHKSYTISYVGAEEASKEWKQLFDTEYKTATSKTSLLNILKLSFELLREPLLIGLPYIYYRFFLKK